jgi:hypothetical protein
MPCAPPVTTTTLPLTIMRFAFWAIEFGSPQRHLQCTLRRRVHCGAGRSPHPWQNRQNKYRQTS